MSKYIEKSTVKEMLKSVLYDAGVVNPFVNRLADNIINKIPSDSTISVVQCKDCVNSEEIHDCPGSYYCWHWNYEEGESPNWVDSNDFCSRGKHREEDV